MDKSNKILSDLTVHMKYAKYLPEQERRETWQELVERNVSMHVKKYPKLENEIRQNYQFVFDRKVLPSMRSLQFAGKAIEVNNSRLYNCSYFPAKDIKFFSELMFLLLGGSGVGYSVQKHHVEQIPPIISPKKYRRYVIEDSIAGWAESVKMLFKSYTLGNTKPLFDFSQIRPKGVRLITAGGKAPGPAPLKLCLTKIENILENANGRKLTTIEVHEIACHIADSVLTGGIRRAAMISYFSIDDDDMLSCKSGSWWELHPEFARANNSVVLERSKVTYEQFLNLWERVKLSNAGEPGFMWTNDKEILGNPCNEISLKPYGFCNLTEINSSDLTTQEEFEARARAAAFIGTLQASYTDFYYLRDEWAETAQEEALLGVSLTGIAANAIKHLDSAKAAIEAVKENTRVAKLLGTKPAKRVTTIKPAGTTSLVLGCASGIHAYHSKYYIRRMRIDKSDSLYTYLSIYHPELLEDDYFKPGTTAIIKVPQKAPENAILRTESANSLLERVKHYYNNWILPGHNSGANTHNISVTISVKDNEWDGVGQWMWINKNHYNGISVLPFDGGTYKQAPFEDCTEEQYNEMYKSLHDIDLTKVVELDDSTNLTGELACAGNNCEIK